MKKKKGKDLKIGEHGFPRMQKEYVLYSTLFLKFPFSPIFLCSDLPIFLFIFSGRFHRDRAPSWSCIDLHRFVPPATGIAVVFTHMYKLQRCQDWTETLCEKIASRPPIQGFSLKMWLTSRALLCPNQNQTRTKRDLIYA